MIATWVCAHAAFCQMGVCNPFSFYSIDKERKKEREKFDAVQNVQFDCLSHNCTTFSVLKNKTFIYKLEKEWQERQHT